MVVSSNFKMNKNTDIHKKDFAHRLVLRETEENSEMAYSLVVSYSCVVSYTDVCLRIPKRPLLLLDAPILLDKQNLIVNCLCH